MGHLGDFVSNPDLTARLQNFIKHMQAISPSAIVSKVAITLHTRLKRPQGKPTEKKDCPPSLFKPLSPGSEFGFLDCNEMEIARQLTLIDFIKLSSIMPREFMGTHPNQ